MKALTVCQPYAHLICLPETDPRHKRVENREWPTNYRGPLAIHAGKSREWLDLDENDSPVDSFYAIPIAEMSFGAVVSIATLIDCCHIEKVRARYYDVRYPWLRQHIHASGTWCWVLKDVNPAPKPIPYRGAQGLFEIPDDLLLLRAMA